MAQVKKLQAGQTVPVNTSTTPKKRLYRGVEITDEDINQYEQELGRWTRENTNNSGDLRKLDSHIKTIASELRNNADIELNPTGLTRVGSVSAAPGKRGTLGTDLNLFGNIRDEQGTALDKTTEFFDKLIEAKKTPTTESSTTTPTQKYHSDLSRTISDRYFGGNWENAQKGIGELTSDKRLAYVKEGLKDSILKYKQEYGEDSKYAGRLAEIDKATPERIKEIAYEMGMDASEYLEGSAAEKAAAKQKADAQNRYLGLEQQFGTKINDDFLTSKGLVAFINKDNVTNLFNDSDLSQYSGDNYIEKKFGNNYGWGMFKSPTKGWYWGTKEDLEKIPEINQTVAGTYTATQNDYRTARNNPFKEGKYTVDFNTETSPFFTRSAFNQYKENNKFQFHDFTNSFTNTDSKARIVIPNKGVKEDILGGVDIENNIAFIIEENKTTPIKITIDKATNRATAIVQDGTNKIIDLGIFGDSMNVNNRNPNDFNYKYSKVIADGLKYDDVLNEDFTLLDHTGKDTGKPINSQNIYQHITNILNGRYNAVDNKEVIKLAKITKKYLDKYPQNWDKATIEKLNRKLIGMATEPFKHIKGTYSTSNSDSNEEPTDDWGKFLKAIDWKKQGGKIVKAQVGATLRRLQDSQNVKVLKSNNPEIKNTVIKPEYGDLKLKDIGKKDLSISDTADIASTGLDALSLVGGPLGVLAGVASTAVQGYGDFKRGGFNKDFANNLAMNLGFTALALVPGLSAAKFAKGAVKATELLKDAEKAEKLVMKAAKYSKNAEKVAEAELKLKSLKKAQEVVKNKNVIATALNNKIVKGAANTARVGLTVTGAINAGSSAANIWDETNGLDNTGNIRVSDIRGLLGGVGAYKSAKGYTDNYLIKRGTTRTVSDVELPRTVKVKVGDGKTEDITIGKYSKNDVNQKIKDHYQEKANAKDVEINDLQAKRIDGVENKDLNDRITKLQDEQSELLKKASTAEIDKNFFKSIKNSSTDLKEKGKNWLNKNTNDWDSRKLKDFDKNASWVDKLAHKKARQAGFEKDGYQMTYEEVMGKLYPGSLMDLQRGTSVKGAYSQIKGERADIKKSNKAVDAIEAMFKFRDLKVKGLKQNKNLVNSNKKKLRNNQQEQSNWGDYGGMGMFKQGGQLIPKFALAGTLPTPKPKFSLYNEGKADLKLKAQRDKVEANLNKVWDPNSAIYKSGETKKYISGQEIKTPIYNIKPTYGQPKLMGNELPDLVVNGKKPAVESTTQTSSPKTIVADSKKANLNLNAGILREIPKLANALSTNAKNARIMASVKPVLAQMPTETYKPVVTNLANENFVNNQVTSYLRQANKPVTSDASLQKAMQFEAMSKTTPMTIQARAANTDMYNQTLGASKESAEKYNLMRNEVDNAERLGAHDARIASIYAGKNVANNASWGNFFDKSNQLVERDNMYKHQLNTQTELQRLQRERQDKLKPSYERYTNSLTDPKSTNIYKIAEKWNKEFPNKRLEDYTENGKTYSELLALEQANNQKAYESESEKLSPYYENQFLNLNYKNPYTREFNIGTYKKGGSVDSKVEIQNLKNKMKAKEMDAKYADKALDRKQKEVNSILNGLSKESLFLLKTMLGK